ncbi:MAG: DUF1640 domain-containing protein [Myxococcales bacterium]|nr:DUF1640 domain-containing protein [Myxococcales bacterium]
MSKASPETSFATKADVHALRDDVHTLRDDVHAVRGDVDTLRADVHTLRVEMNGIRDDLRTEMHGMRDDLRTEMHGMRDELRSEMHGIRDTLLDTMHGLGAQLESMRPIFRATGERESTIEDSLKRQIAEGEQKADDRLKDVEAVTRRHSGALGQHGSALASLRAELEGLRAAYHVPNSPEVAAFEARLAKLEEAVGIARP